ncbi:tetratricopeptide repeat protein [Aidingimonas halophila]|uniref:Tetratricopeptide repeat-containing protein n=1 Tax=Aidingimonas halophila TaxID=574349 RepID=A0A1H2RM66_9GAMM|nr:tetratricopeptide repeat protein [Aidingimonas halophila]GHC19082.1 hypothetical protein GCM10008094_06260 [Aidingimonas halophila]SDW19739.1 Tetratricopeptide repeat-containing protein [Aidingimonas halophila]
MRYCRLLGTALLVMALVAPGLAVADEEAVDALRERWETITTEVPESEQEQAYAELVDQATRWVDDNPEEADARLWRGISLASQARAKGGTGALGLAKEAREDLEKAVELDPDGGNGSAYVTLGALYHRVPGWPLGFGDSDTAEALFQSAREIRPDGVDVNYYYAVFLEDEGRDDDAREYARRAVEGDVRESRQASDEALRDKAWELAERLSNR